MGGNSMKKLLAFLAVLLVAGPALAANFDMLQSQDRAGYRFSATSAQTTSDYIVAPARYRNVLSFTKGSAFAATVYACEFKDYAVATCGTAETTLSTTTDEVEVLTAKPWLVFDITTAETGSNVSYLSIASNANNAGMGGGVTSDPDGDGLYEVANLWDADGDGSTFVTCTGNATPDIACKAIGEVVYRDTIDDINCAIRGGCAGGGRMERDGVLILKGGVWLGFPCWNASAPGTHTAAQAETDDSGHDLSASSANCPVDADGNILVSAALQDWGGIIMGQGTDSRRLHRGLMGASLRRDRGTYFANDYGPMHLSSDDNRWFGATTNIQMINAGYNNNYTNTAHFTGASLASGDSKGWWKINAAVDYETWGGATNSLCLTNTGGSVGTDYAASGTVGTLRRGDILVVPSRSNPNASAMGSYSEVRVRSQPTASCGSGGLQVPLGGDLASSETAGSGTNRAVLPAYTSNLVTSGLVGHARSKYKDTNVTIMNMNLEAQDPYNEIGGRCGSSGSYTAPSAVTSTGTIFTTTIDDTNTDFSCDTQQFVGLWGSGNIRLSDVIVNNFHFYPVDGGTSGGRQVLEDVTFLHGNGGPIIDASGSGWEMRRTKVEDSTFSTIVVSVFLSGLTVDDFVIRNSSFGNISAFNAQAEATTWTHIRAESSSFDSLFYLDCDSRRHVFRDLYITGRGYFAHGGVPTGILFICSNTATPIRDNVVDGFIVDAPDYSGGTESVPILAYQATAGNEAAILGNSFSNFHALGYSGGTTDQAGCLFGAYTNDPDTVDVTHNHSIVFKYNMHSNSSVAANGSVFCLLDNTLNLFQTQAELTSTTPAWGDPVGCGNFDGSVLIPYERCDGSELGNGTLAVDFGSMLTTACSSAITTTLTGLTTADTITWGFLGGDPTGVVGYSGTTGVDIEAYATTDTVNFKACNRNLATVDPATRNFWWKASR